MINLEAKKNDQTILYDYICRKLSSNGLSKKEFDCIRRFPIGHNSVEGFVKLNIALGNLDWRGNALINVDRTFTLKLTLAEEDELKKRAKGLNLTPGEMVTQIVLERLSRK